MKLAIIIGGCEKKQGPFAVSPIRSSAYSFWKEQALDIWRYAKDCELDCQIFLQDDREIKGLVDDVNKWLDGDGASIQLYLNDSIDTTLRGCETQYANDSDLRFAKYVHANQLKALTEKDLDFNTLKKIKDRGLKQLKDSDKGFINMLMMEQPSVIVKPFFATNQKDCELFSRNKLRYSKALVRAFIEYKLIKGE